MVLIQKYYFINIFKNKKKLIIFLLKFLSKNKYIYQKWIAFPEAAIIHASFNASLKVGCEWQVLPTYSAVIPCSMANTPSAISSPAYGPIIWQPNILPVTLSDKTLIKPSGSSLALALALAKKGN